VRGHLQAAIVALALTLAAASTSADVLHLKDGDRITGKILSRTSRAVRIQTPYGRLLIPRDKIERIERAGDQAEAAAPAEIAPPAAPVARPLRLILVVMGKSFWHAWDSREEIPDLALRFEVRVDEDVVATFVDPKADPDELPKAVVNTFSFGPEEVVAQPGPGARVLPPEVRPGRVVLKIDVPQVPAVSRRLRLAYQVNSGPPAKPAWHDVAEGSLTLPLKVDGPNFVQVRQDLGAMEFSGFPRRRMKKVETFVMGLSPE